jgi:hypothetical protein
MNVFKQDEPPQFFIVEVKPARRFYKVKENPSLSSIFCMGIDLDAFDPSDNYRRGFSRLDLRVRSEIGDEIFRPRNGHGTVGIGNLCLGDEIKCQLPLALCS